MICYCKLLYVDFSFNLINSYVLMSKLDYCFESYKSPNVHAILYSWLFNNHFIVILYHFLVLTYWHSAKCQLLFSACFLHHRKSIPNGVQTQWNFLWIFFGPEDIQWAEEARGGVLRGEHNPPRRAWRPRRALVGCAHLGCPPDCLFAL